MILAKYLKDATISGKRRRGNMKESKEITEEKIRREDNSKRKG
jgi:hypothetical protein